MTLSWNEIKSRAVEFSNEWKDEFNEHAEAKSFMDGFFNVFGISRRQKGHAHLPGRDAEEMEIVSLRRHGVRPAIR